MNILGFHGGLVPEEDERRTGFASHDSAAALLKNGTLVAAIEEERLSRLKHSNGFPVRAVEYCLARGGLSLHDIDAIAFNLQKLSVTFDAQEGWLANPTRSSGHDAVSLVADCFRRSFDVDVSSKIAFCPHHLAHAWSAFAPSGYEESLILVADGDGDDLSGMVLLGRGTTLQKLRTYSIAKSLGNLYSRVIGLIGYTRFDEYKAMGLAPYGNPQVYDALFAESYRLLPDGDYDLDPPEKWGARFEAAGLVACARRKGQAFTQAHMDVAAALQRCVERILLHVLAHYGRQTGQKNLCIAGGVGHNCSANGAILYSGLFDRVFVQPAAHDAGGAVGAALAIGCQRGERIESKPWTHVYFGSDLGDDRAIVERLQRWRGLITIDEIGDSPDEPARQLADGAVIGWAQGRSEFGPRALGNRSIVADPRPAANKGRINAMVKKRESFRPFAPAVLVERVRDYFEVPARQAEFPFMVFVLKVRPEVRGQLGAITHIDGTARVQTVSRGDNPRFWSLIRAFEAITGVGMLLNTSLNNNAEPIVDTVDDAIACFLTTGLDRMVIGNYLVSKGASEIAAECYGHLTPRLPGFGRLVARRSFDPKAADYRNVFAVESTRSYYFGPTDTVVTEQMWEVLRLSDGRCPLNTLIERAGVPRTGAHAVYTEAAQLWGSRIISLTPA